ncbi:MAG: MFS transporter [Meiothermus sp.]|nr:MFS transporter [Meiothermus sp.]
MRLSLPRFIEKALAGLPRNARNSILVEPMWLLFGVVVIYYAPLYMTGVGLSSAQVGIIGSMGLAFAFVFQTFAATITNRMGRKRTTLLWDLVAWTMPMLVWAFSQNFLTFALAALLNASGKIVNVSWNLLVIEDVKPADRARVFGILNLLGAAAGLMTPVVGLLIEQYGVVPVLRVFYFLGAISMTTMFFLRNSITDETHNGAAAMREHQGIHPFESLRKNLEQLRVLGSTKALPWLVGFYALTFFLEQMNLFQVLFFSQTLGFGALAVSLVPVAMAAVTLLLHRLVLPRLAGLSAERALVISCAVALAGAVLIALIPKGNLFALLLAVCVASGATFLIKTYRETVLFHHLPTHGTADLFSAVQALTMLVSIPAAALAGAIFAVQPVALFALIAVLNLVLLALSWMVASFQQQAVRPA